MTTRPPFLRSTAEVPEHTFSYPGSDEKMGPSRAVGKAAGLRRIGLHVQRLPPGARSSWPHAEEDEEEFVYVLEGAVDAWVDGALHPMVAGDVAAFPAGTGVSHTFLNNGTRDATLLVGGEAAKSDSRIFYPLHPSRRTDLTWSQWWDDVPGRAGVPIELEMAKKKTVPCFVLGGFGGISSMYAKENPTWFAELHNKLSNEDNQFLASNTNFNLVAGIIVSQLNRAAGELKAESH